MLGLRLSARSTSFSTLEKRPWARTHQCKGGGEANWPLLSLHHAKRQVTAGALVPRETKGNHVQRGTNIPKEGGIETKGGIETNRFPGFWVTELPITRLP